MAPLNYYGLVLDNCVTWDYLEFPAGWWDVPGLDAGEVVKDGSGLGLLIML